MRDDLGEDDLRRAAAIAFAGATGNSGQRRTAIKRVLVQESVADAFVPMLLARALRFGDPLDPATELGCVIDATAAECFETRVLSAAEVGAEILYHPPRQGALLPPIVLDRVPRDAELVMEETFGPVIPILRVPDDDAAVMAISNATPFGLSSGVCTNDLNRAIAFVNNLGVGTVNIREQLDYRIEMSPFGGIKASGNGIKKGVIEAVKCFTNVQTCSLPGPKWPPLPALPSGRAALLLFENIPGGLGAGPQSICRGAHHAALACQKWIASWALRVLGSGCPPDRGRDGAAIPPAGGWASTTTGRPGTASLTPTTRAGLTVRLE